MADQSQPAWMADLAKRHEALIERNGPGTDAVTREALLKMKDEDQAARGMNSDATHKDHVEIATNLADIDAALTTQLKTIVQAVGWPTISLVGYDASNAAMLILAHTRDHAWQLSLLPQLEDLADTGKIDGSSLALVIDKELVAEGKLQRYGTQFKRIDSGIALYGVEDPAGLDERRAKVFLPPLEYEKQRMSQMYHLPVSKQVVMATPQAK
jgi:hypothetical protein